MVYLGTDELLKGFNPLKDANDSRLYYEVTGERLKHSLHIQDISSSDEDADESIEHAFGLGRSNSGVNPSMLEPDDPENSNNTSLLSRDISIHENLRTNSDADWLQFS